MAIVGLVPARGGSKAIPRKNLAPCGGKPLLAWTAEAALGAGALDRVILTTDDEEIAASGRQLGLDVPFLRPPKLAGDATPMLAVLRHALAFLRDERTSVDAFVLLQPTSPLRRARHIADALTLFHARRAATLVSTVPVPHRFVPSSLMYEQDGRLLRLDGGDPGSPRRQDKERLYARNGPAILIVRPDVLDADRLYGDPTIGFEMSETASLDVDGPDDLRLADLMLRNNWT